MRARAGAFVARSIAEVRRGGAVPASLHGAVVSDVMAMMLVVLAGVGAVTGRPLVTTLGSLVFVVAVVARLWARVALEEVHFEWRSEPARAAVGDDITLVVVLENRKPVPVPWLRLTLPLGAGLEARGDELEVRPIMGGVEAHVATSLRAYDRVRIRLPLRATRRGWYPLAPARLVSGDLFGFYHSRHEVDGPRRGLVVYPRTVPMPGLALPPARPIGDALSRVRMAEDRNRPAGVREYRPGDAVKTIDWKATARRAEPFVRTHDASATHHVVILLECDTTRLWRWANRPERLEACVVLAASVATRAIALGYRVGLVANGVTSGYGSRAVLPPGRGTTQLPALMDALARVQSFTLRSLRRLSEEHGAEAIPYGATIVYVTGMTNRETLQYLRGLAGHGHRVERFFVGDEPPGLEPGMPIHHVRPESLAGDEVHRIAPGNPERGSTR